MNSSTGPPTSLNFLCSESMGGYMNITFLTNASGTLKVVNETTVGFTNSTQYAYNVSWIDSYSTTYYWTVNVTNDNDYYVNETYLFTTKSAPTSGLVYPANQSTEIESTPSCHIFANNSCGDACDVYFSENSTGSWIVRQSNLSVTANTSVYWEYSQATGANEEYWWRVNISCSPNQSYYYTFTRGENEVFTAYSTLTFGGKADTAEGVPEITIMYIGNKSNSGGPFFIPGLENTSVGAGTLPYADDGYFTNNSQQHGNVITTEANITNITGTDAIYACYYNYNKTTWDNKTMYFNSTSGRYENISTFRHSR